MASRCRPRSGISQKAGNCSGESADPRAALTPERRVGGDQATPARQKADWKLPKRLLIGRSVGTMPAAVHDWAVGETPNSSTRLRIAFSAAASRSSEGPPSP